MGIRFSLPRISRPRPLAGWAVLFLTASLIPTGAQPAYGQACVDRMGIVLYDHEALDGTWRFGDIFRLSGDGEEAFLTGSGPTGWRYARWSADGGFTLLPDNGLIVIAVSANLAYAVGQTPDGGYKRWTTATGELVTIPKPASTILPVAVTTGGAVFLHAYEGFVNWINYKGAFRWTPGSLQNIGDANAEAYLADVSDDGSVAIGYYLPFDEDGVVGADALYDRRWTAASGDWTALDGVPDQWVFVFPNNLSPDGTYVIGRVNSGDEDGDGNADERAYFRWSAPDNFEELEALASLTHSVVLNDGTILSNSGSSGLDYVWPPGGGGAVTREAWFTERGVTDLEIALDDGQQDEAAGDGRTFRSRDNIVRLGGGCTPAFISSLSPGDTHYANGGDKEVIHIQTNALSAVGVWFSPDGAAFESVGTAVPGQPVPYLHYDEETGQWTDVLEEPYVAWDAPFVWEVPQVTASRAVLRLSGGGVTKDYTFRITGPPEASWHTATDGFFNEPANWSTDQMPGATITTRFDASTTVGYTVTFGQDVETRAAVVDSSVVEFGLGGHTYTLNDPAPAAGLRVGIAEDRPAGLILEDGAVDVQDAVLGEAAGSAGTLIVDVGAALDVGGELTLGDSGSGTLGVLPGGAVTIESGLLMAHESGSEALLTAHGPVQVVEGILTVIGHEGAADVTMFSGGFLSATGPLFLGFAPGGEGELTFRDGSSGITFDTLYIGYSGRGGLSVVAGSGLTSANAVVGREAGSAGTVTVEGAGSHWVVSNTLRLGIGGVSVLFLRDGGTLGVNRVEIGPLSSADLSGGTITIGSALPSKTAAAIGTGTVAAEGGLLQADTLLLAEGATLVADAIVLNPGGMLGGGGTLELPTVNGGVLAPGGPGATGVFALAAGYEQQPGGALEIELAGPSAGEYDALTVTGEAALGGTLRLKLLKGYHPEVGHTFEIVTASSLNGTFESVEAQEGIVADVVYGEQTVTVTLTEVTTTPVEEPDEALPEAYALEQNYPNPFNPATRIAFELPEAGPVLLVVYDLLGREVKALAEGRYGPGRHDVVFDGSGLPSGIYVYRLQTGGQVFIRYMVLVK